MTDNPLLGIPFAIPFDRIEAAHVGPAVDALLKQAQARVDAVAALEGPRTFENTLLALEEASRPLGEAMAAVHHLEAVHTTPAFRDAYNAVQPLVSAFYSNLVLNEGLWKAIKAFSQTDEAKNLRGARARFLKKTVDDFRREGADLPPDRKKCVAEIHVALTQLTTRFSQNVLDATNAFELYVADEGKLAGLPESAKEAAKLDAEKRGRKDAWRFTLQAPSFIPVMTYLDDAEIRRELWRAYNVRASDGEKDNTPLIDEILALRAERARILGFGDFADLVLDDRMAHDGRRAMAFIEDLRQKSQAAFDRENEELAAFRRETQGRGAAEMQPWDAAYWAEKQRKALYDFDEEELRPYFPLEPVIEGMFRIVSRLYGIEIVRTHELPAWHEDVRTYDIRDADGTHLASFYADLFPREDKRGGAWMSDFLTGGPQNESFKPHSGAISANLNPPVGDKPALLSHRDVETLFHEFGHLLHHALSRVEIRSLSGTNVAWDFVELPSQIMENWCWEREALDLFGRHYRSGEKIPQALFEKMIRAKNFRSANAMMRQLGFATVDLKLHVEYDPAKDGPVLPYARKILQRFSVSDLPEDYAMICGFTHLFAAPVAYAAGYYSYKWAEVLDADAFSRFKKEGVFSAKVGAAFRGEILAKGDSDDPMNLFKAFMGREPDPNALLLRSGLA